MSDNAEPTRKRRRWFNRRNLLVAVVILVALYALIGIVGVPLVAQKYVIPKVNESLPAPDSSLAVERVRFNPFTLRLALDGIDLNDAFGEPLVDVERLVVDAQWSSLWSAYRLRELTVQKPVITLKLRQAESREGEAPAEPPPAPPPPPGDGENPATLPIDLAEIAKMIRDLPRVAVDKLTVSDGGVVFEDHTSDQPFRDEIQALSFTLENFDSDPPNENTNHFTARTRGGGKFQWDNTLYTDPLAVTGAFAIDGLGLANYTHYTQQGAAVHLSDGVFSMHVDYRFEPFADPPVIGVTLASLTLDELASRTDTPLPVMAAVRALSLGPVRVDLIASRVEIDALTTDGVRLLLVRDDQAPLVLPPEGSEPLQVDDAEPSSPEALDPMPAPMSATPGKGGITSPESATSPEPAAPASQPLLVVTGEDGQTTTLIDLASPWTVTVKRIEYTDYRVGLVDALPDASIVSPSDAEPSAELAASDTSVGMDAGETLAGFDRFRIDDVVLLDRPTTVTVKHVLIDGLVALAQIGPDGRLTMPRVACAQPPPEVAPTETADASTPTASTEPSPPLTASIARIELTNGRLNVRDLSQRSAFDFPISDIAGSIAGVSSDPSVPTVVNIGAMLPGASQAKVKGSILRDPDKTDVDIALTVAGLVMTPFTPYSGRYVGYGVEEGRLNLNITYWVKGSQLKGDHVVSLDRFYLGDSIESSEAIELPVKLGLELLRDLDQQIGVEVPVEGDLDDPTFRLGPAVWGAVVNLFTRVMTSPFSFIGDQFGGGDLDLSFVAFEPGQTQLAPDEAAKLDVLGKAMTQRPALTLDVMGQTDDADARILRKQKLVDTIRVTDQTQTVTDERYERAVRRLADRIAPGEAGAGALDEFKKDEASSQASRRTSGGREGATVHRSSKKTVTLEGLLFGTDDEPAGEAGDGATPPTFTELEARVLATVEVTDADRAVLATARAETVKRYLVEEGGVAAERITLDAAIASQDDKPAEAVARFELK